MELVLPLDRLLTEVLLALAEYLFELRRTRTLSRSQIVFVLFTAGGLALLCCPAALLLFSVFTVMPLFFFRVIIETGMMLIVLGAFLVFSSLRFADVLLKDVLRTYWWGIILSCAWLGLQAILSERAAHA